MVTLGMRSVEKELNEGTCLFVNFILPARRRQCVVRSFVRSFAMFRNLKSIDIDPA
jgi:hypothetical protein